MHSKIINYHLARFLVVLVLSSPTWTQALAQGAAEKPLYDWVFSGTPANEVLSVGRNQTALKAVEAKGAALATSAGGSGVDSVWQFVQPPSGQAGGLSAEIDAELRKFQITVSCNLNARHSFSKTEYLAGFQKRTFIRFTEANRLEAGIFIPGEGWKNIGIGLVEIAPWERWMEINLGYADGLLVLNVDGTKVASLDVGNTSLQGGRVFIVGAMPWGVGDGAFTGQIRRITIDDHAVSKPSGK